MIKILTVTIATLAFTATAALAQEPVQGLELGLDAGVTIGLGDNSATTINIPAQAFRVGFPMTLRSSLEPKLRLNIHTGGGETVTEYRAEVGWLYHLGSSRYPGAYQRAGVFLRPFVGVAGVSDGDSDSYGLLGAGVGLKMPLISRLSTRFEANFAHQFGNGDSNEIGLLAGLSFFTR